MVSTGRVVRLEEGAVEERARVGTSLSATDFDRVVTIFYLYYFRVEKEESFLSVWVS